MTGGAGVHRDAWPGWCDGCDVMTWPICRWRISWPQWQHDRWGDGWYDQAADMTRLLVWYDQEYQGVGCWCRYDGWYDDMMRICAVQITRRVLGAASGRRLKEAISSSFWNTFAKDDQDDYVLMICIHLRPAPSRSRRCVEVGGDV